MTKTTTLVEVAQHAGVSTATVSRVLRNKGYVAPQTRARVEESIRVTGFRVNAVAQGLRSQRTFTIGHLMQSIAPNPFFAQVALGVEHEARRNGYSVLMFNVNGNARFETEGLNRLIERRVDAVIFTTAVDAENVRTAVAAGLPVVQVERNTPVATHMVKVDNYAGAAEATLHLIELGHSDIAYIGLDPAKGPVGSLYEGQRGVERQRMAGFIETMQLHGKAIHDDFIRICSDYSNPERVGAAKNEAYETTLALLNGGAHPTAIFATCDIFAAGVLQAVYELGLRVPDDISVIGFDDTYAGYLTPPLTTVHQPMMEIGRAAARIVTHILQEETPAFAPLTETLTSKLVIRGSTGPKRS